MKRSPLDRRLTRLLESRKARHIVEGSSSSRFLTSDLVLLVGLTGNIASGKSRVADRLASHGAVVIDADQLARRAVEPGTPALAEIAQRWGPDMVRADGTLDRAALRAIVFASERERLALNAIVHPRVEALREEEIARARAAGARIVVCDIPLLFELRMAPRFDQVVLVDAPEAVRLRRLQRDRGLGETEAKAMMASQMNAREKRGGAHVIIENDGDLAALNERVDALWHAWRDDSRAAPSSG